MNLYFCASISRNKKGDSLNNHDVLLLKITGEDKPGVTSRITQILSQHHVTILDIGQAVIHNDLSLGMLITLPSDTESSSLLKELLLKAYELGIEIRFEPITAKEYSQWVNAQGKERFIISLLARKITAEQISCVTDIIYDQGLNIDIINRLTGRIPLTGNKSTVACVELSVRGTPRDINTMKSAFYNLSRTIEADISFQKDDIYRRNRRLVCFDMDSTLIQTEVIVELAKVHGVGDEVHRITEAAMQGELDFEESFKKRIALLKGLDVSVMEKIAANLPLTEGAERLLNTLNRCGYKTAILSGGFTFFGEYLQKKFNIDYMFANELEIHDGKLTGRHIGDIINGTRKAELLKLIAQMEGIHREQVIAVGDGANDLPMINAAGLGIAFHAKSKVRENAGYAISTVGLDGILYLLGFRDRMLAE
ncbi:MAG: phosphoserine phosphatase SerB [Candidatus Marinimicrobia bacterium]|nr:phosphoserine phosphatase SerB [Candidatus Neomarinimicrobiota bacterium]